MTHQVRALLAEFIGTFTLCFVGIASGIVAPNFGIAAPAFAHGLIVTGLIYTYGHLSGAHFNPSVTVGLLVGGKITVINAALYMGVQFIGGVIAAFLIVGIVGADSAGTIAFLNDAATFNYGQTTGYLTQPNVWGAAIIEAILVFFLLSVIYQSAVYGKAGNNAGLAIGLTLAALIFATGGMTGASINPARTLGPALAAGDLSYLMPYFIGLFGGGIIAGIVNSYMLVPVEK